MGEKINLNIKLDKETVQQIDGLVKYYKIRKLLTQLDLPETYEDFIKAAIYSHLQRLERFHTFLISEDTLKLKKKQRLQNKIKEYMAQQGLRLTDLSRLTEIDAGSLSSILSNRNQPSIEFFLRIWIALGCPPIEELFYRDTT